MKGFALFVLMGFPLLPVYAATCRDFATQGDAQRYHDEQGGNTRLDRDNDGEACECLPGGSAYGNPKCKRG